MIKKLFFTSIFLLNLLLLNACSSSDPIDPGIDNDFSQDFSDLIYVSPNNQYVVFPAEIKNYLNDKAQRYMPTDQEAQQAMEIVLEFVKANEALRDPQNYKFQLFGHKNNNQEKIIHFNAFCSADKFDWQKNPVLVLDGGNCYFNLKFNLDLGEIFDVYVNGVA